MRSPASLQIAIRTRPPAGTTPGMPHAFGVRHESGIRDRPRVVGAAARLPGVRAGQAGEVLMTAVGWAQIALFFVVVFALAKPLGAYMFRVFELTPPLPR